MKVLTAVFPYTMEEPLLGTKKYYLNKYYSCQTTAIPATSTTITTTTSTLITTATTTTQPPTTPTTTQLTTAGPCDMFSEAACDITEENTVAVKHDLTVGGCQDLCAGTAQCHVFTWYPSIDNLGICFLLKECNDLELCPYCISGPEMGYDVDTCYDFTTTTAASTTTVQVCLQFDLY